MGWAILGGNFRFAVLVDMMRLVVVVVVVVVVVDVRGREMMEGGAPQRSEDILLGCPSRAYSCYRICMAREIWIEFFVRSSSLSSYTFFCISTAAGDNDFLDERQLFSLAKISFSYQEAVLARGCVCGCSARGSFSGW